MIAGVNDTDHDIINLEVSIQDNRVSISAIAKILLGGCCQSETQSGQAFWVVSASVSSPMAASWPELRAENAGCD